MRILELLRDRLMAEGTDPDRLLGSARNPLNAFPADLGIAMAVRAAAFVDTLITLAVELADMRGVGGNGVDPTINLRSGYRQVRLSARAIALPSTVVCNASLSSQTRIFAPTARRFLGAVAPTRRNDAPCSPRRNRSVLRELLPAVAGVGNLPCRLGEQSKISSQATTKLRASSSAGTDDQHRTRIRGHVIPNETGDQC